MPKRIDLKVGTIWIVEEGTDGRPLFRVLTPQEAALVRSALADAESNRDTVGNNRFLLWGRGRDPEILPRVPDREA